MFSYMKIPNDYGFYFVILLKKAFFYLVVFLFGN